MEVNGGIRPCLSSCHVVVGSSVAIKTAVSIIVPHAGPFVELVLLLLCLWTFYACWHAEQREERAIEDDAGKDNDSSCSLDAQSQKERENDEVAWFLLPSVCCKAELLASLVDNLDRNRGFKVDNNSKAMTEKEAIHSSSPSPCHTLDEPSLDLRQQRHQSKQSVNGGSKKGGNSTNGQPNGVKRRSNNGGHNSQPSVGSSGIGGSSSGDGGEDDDKRQRQAEKWVSSEWSIDVERLSGEVEEVEGESKMEDSHEETDKDDCSIVTSDLLQMSSSPVDIGLQTRKSGRNQHVSPSSATPVTPTIRSMPDSQLYSLQLNLPHSRTQFQSSQRALRRASFSQMSPRALIKRRQLKRTGVSESALQGSMESQVMTLELAFQCQARCGHQQWKACRDRGCRNTREQLEHYSNCLLRQFRKALGVADCHRCMTFLTLIWRHAEKCQRIEKCPVFKCQQMKAKMLPAAPFPSTTMRTYPLPISSSLLISGPDLTSEAVPTSTIQSLPPHLVSQTGIIQTNERSQSWPIDVGSLLQQHGAPPAALHRKLSDIERLPQLAEDVSFASLNTGDVAGRCDVSEAGEVNEGLPGTVNWTSDEVIFGDLNSRGFRSGEAVLQIEELSGMPPFDMLQSPVPSQLEKGAEEEFAVLWPLNKGVLTPNNDKYVAQEDFMECALLGQGAFAEVWLALDVASGSMLAVKKPFASESLQQRELNIWGELDHHNFVKLFGAVQHGQKIYIFQEYVEGGSLSCLLVDDKGSTSPLPEVQALIYCFQVLQGLSYLHDIMGIVHRDIKPENILVKENNVIKIADFGLAIAICDIPLDVEKSFHPAGTDCYMPPEVARGEVYSTNRDVWSVGCVLLKLLTGKAPYDHLRHMPSLIFVIGNSENGPEIPLKCCSKFVMEFFRVVFARREDRPSAVQLLTHETFCRPFESLITPQTPEPPVTMASQLTHPFEAAVLSQTQSTDPTDDPDGDIHVPEVNERIQTTFDKPENLNESPAAILAGLASVEQTPESDRELETRTGDASPDPSQLMDLEVSPSPFQSPSRLFSHMYEPEINQPVESIHHEGLHPIVESPAPSGTSTVQSSTGSSMTPMQSLTSKSVRDESTSMTATTEEVGESKELTRLYNQQPSDEPGPQEAEGAQERSTQHVQRPVDSEETGVDKMARQRQEALEAYCGDSEDTPEAGQEPSDSQSAEQIREDYYPAKTHSRESSVSLSSVVSQDDIESWREYAQYEVRKDGSMTIRSRPHSRVYGRSMSYSGIQHDSEVYGGSGASGRHQRVLRSVSRSSRHESQEVRSGIQQKSFHHSRHHGDSREQYGQRGNRDVFSNQSNTSGSFTTAPNASGAHDEVSQKGSQTPQRCRQSSVRQPIGLPLDQPLHDVRTDFKGRSPLDGKAQVFGSGQQQEPTNSYVDFSDFSASLLDGLNQMAVGRSTQGRVVAPPSEQPETELGLGEMAFGRASGFVGSAVSARRPSLSTQTAGSDFLQQTSTQQDLQPAETDRAQRWLQSSSEQASNVSAAAVAQAAVVTGDVAVRQPDCFRVEVYDCQVPTKPLFIWKSLVGEMSAGDIAKSSQATVRTKMPMVRAFTLGLVQDDRVVPLDKKKHFMSGTGVRVAVVPVREDNLTFNTWFVDERGNIRELASSPKSPMSSLV